MMAHYRLHLAIAVLLTLTVASPTLSEDRFTDNGDGTVTDHRLRIMWAATDNQGNINWHDARRWIRFTFPYTIAARYTGWRMPTLDELKSLYQRAKTYDGYETDCGQRVKISPEIQLSCGWVWSGDEETVTAAVFNFTRGIHYTDRKVHYRAYRALAVRDLD